MRPFAALLFVLVLSGCGSDHKGTPASKGDDAPTVSQSDTSSPSPSAPSTAKIRPYIDKLASNDATELQAGADSAAKGSLAAAYLQHQANQAIADDDGGVEPEQPGVITQQGSDYRVCYESGKKKNCYVYGDFRLAADGSVAGFTVDDKPLAKRLTMGNGRAIDSSLAKVTFLSAYTTQSGDEAIVVKIRAKGQAISSDATTSYRAPDGRQRQEYAVGGPTEISPNSAAYQAFYFRGPIKFGGTMTLKLFTSQNDSVDTANLEIKTR